MSHTEYNTPQEQENNILFIFVHCFTEIMCMLTRNIIHKAKSQTILGVRLFAFVKITTMLLRYIFQLKTGTQMCRKSCISVLGEKGIVIHYNSLFNRQVTSREFWRIRRFSHLCLNISSDRGLITSSISWFCFQADLMLEHASPSGVQLSLPLTSFLFLVLSWALWTHFSKSEFTSHQAPCQFHSSYWLNNDLLLLIFFTVLLQTMRTILQSHKPPAKGLPWWLSGKEATCQCRRRGFDPWVRKIPLEKEMATHSSILAWRIPWTEKPGGLQSTGLQRARHNLATKQQGAPGLQSL